MKQLLPLAAAGLVLAACGGVPGNSVATVDGEPIAKTDYDHWNTVVKKLSPGIKSADARNQALQVLVSFRWVDGEAERLGVKVSDADVRKSFAEQKQQAFPKDADYQQFLRDTTQTEADIVARVRVDLLGQKIQEQVVKGDDKVSDKAIADFYAKHKARFAQPEKRDLRVVLTKSKAKPTGRTPRSSAATRGRRWPSGTRSTTRRRRPAASSPPRPRARSTPTSTRQCSPPRRVSSPARSRPSTAITSSSSPASSRLAADARGGQGDDQADVASENQQKALTAFTTEFTQRWREKTECAEGYKTSDCSNGPKATPHPRRVCNNIRMYVAA